MAGPATGHSMAHHRQREGQIVKGSIRGAVVNRVGPRFRPAQFAPQPFDDLEMFQGLLVLHHAPYIAGGATHRK